MYCVFFRKYLNSIINFLFFFLPAPVVVTSQSHAPQGSTVVQGGYYPPQAPGCQPQGLGYPPQTAYQPGQYPQHAAYPPAPMQQPQPPYPVHQHAPVVGVQPPAG